jgi:hypothetical protein
MDAVAVIALWLGPPAALAVAALIALKRKRWWRLGGSLSITIAVATVVMLFTYVGSGCLEEACGWVLTWLTPIGWALCVLGSLGLSAALAITREA